MVLARSLKAGQIQRGVSQRGRRAFMPLHLGIGLIVPAPAPAFLVQRLAVDGGKATPRLAITHKYLNGFADRIG